MFVFVNVVKKILFLSKNKRNLTGSMFATGSKSILNPVNECCLAAAIQACENGFGFDHN